MVSTKMNLDRAMKKRFFCNIKNVKNNSRSSFFIRPVNPDRIKWANE